MSDENGRWLTHLQSRTLRNLIKAQEHIEAARDLLCEIVANDGTIPIWAQAAVKGRYQVLWADGVKEIQGGDGRLFRLDELACEIAGQLAKESEVNP